MKNCKFGPGGIPLSFGKLKFPENLSAYLEGFGLDAFEIECGRGVRVAERTRRLLPDIIKKQGIALSIHAPYYTSLSSVDEETRLKSVEYVWQTAEAAHLLGADRLVVHSGSCAKITRSEALGLAKDTLRRIADKVVSAFPEVTVCPETMGKVNQLGTLEEVIELCKVHESFLPCVDFGHLNARTLGGIKTKGDYAAILDAAESGLGVERARKMHIHFSKIMYTVGGEKSHLTFEDKEYGPEYEPLMELLAERDYSARVICESDGTQAEDGAALAQYYNSRTA